MKASKIVSSVVSGFAFALFAVNVTYALDKYSTTVHPIQNPDPDSSVVRLKKKLNVKLSGSTTDGVGGMVIQITGSGIDCPPNNDGGTDFKCGVDGNPQPDHALALNAEFAGQTIMNVIGVAFSVEKGKPILDLAEGKNKINASDTPFGPFVSFIYDQPLGVGFLKIHEPGSNPADCGTLLVGDPAGCLDGDIYAFEGLNGGYDCTAPCPGQLICKAAGSLASECADEPSDDVPCNVCRTEDCAVPSDCSSFASGVGCNPNTGKCCDPANSTGAPCFCNNNGDCGTGNTCVGNQCQ